MEEIQNVRKLLLRRVAMATVATVGVVAGVGMAPPPAQASQVDLGKAYLRSWSEAIDLEADIDTSDELSAEVGDVGDKAADDPSTGAEAGVEAEASRGSKDLTVHEVMGLDTSSGFEGEFGLVIQQDHGI